MSEALWINWHVVESTENGKIKQGKCKEKRIKEGKQREKNKARKT